MFNELLRPAAVAAGMVVADRVGGQVASRFLSAGPPPAGTAAVVQWGLPGAMLIGGHFLRRQAGVVGAAALGLQVVGLLRIVSSFLPAQDWTFGS